MAAQKRTISKISTGKKNKHKPQIPYYRKPEEMSYEEWQTGLRSQYGIEQNFDLKNIGEHPVFSDFKITNPKTKQTYKVAIRSEGNELNYCSCPDFTINTLGTCKHIEHVLHKLKKKKGNKQQFKLGYTTPYSALYLRYGHKREVVLYLGTHNVNKIKELAKSYFDPNYVLLPDAFDKFEQFLDQAIQIDPSFKCYQDAIDYIIDVRDAHKRVKLIDQIYPDGIASPKLNTLIDTMLYPYQKEAVLFSAKVGRVLIADDMGLGKTIQAIAITELMSQEFGVEKVLIVCPTSLKYQWKAEIEKFSKNSVMVIEGAPYKRKNQYFQAGPIKIISYHLARYDNEVIKQMSPDLVILDEAQKIKNWNTLTAKSIKKIQSPYAIVLTGTPLENRLEELYSIVEFIDRYKLGPLFRFLANHQIIDANNKVVGYKDLHKINKILSSIMIRRTRKEVLKQLPERFDKNYFVEITPKQKEIHDEYYETVCRLVNKWRRHKFLSEKDRQRLLLCLSCMKMVSNSTYILDQQTRHDTKIDELKKVLQDILEIKGEKVVIFSQWERMTRLVAQELDKKEIRYEYLHGGIPSKGRKDLIHNFHHDPKSLVFLSTDAGGVGLNLQCASRVINLDCPWNPAVLEQRIGRVYRLGQTEPVYVLNFISRGTIEERILELLKFKKSVFTGVLDGEKDTVIMDDSKFNSLMKSVEHITNLEEIKKESENPINFKFPQTQITERSISMKQSTPKQEESIEISTKSIQDLLNTGVHFLQKMSVALSNSGAESNSEAESSMDLPFMEKDKNSGKTYFKFPVPDQQIMNKAVSALDVLVEVIKGKSF